MDVEGSSGIKQKNQNADVICNISVPEAEESKPPSRSLTDASE